LSLIAPIGLAAAPGKDRTKLSLHSLTKILALLRGASAEEKCGFPQLANEMAPAAAAMFSFDWLESGSAPQRAWRPAAALIGVSAVRRDQVVASA